MAKSTSRRKPSSENQRPRAADFHSAAIYTRQSRSSATHFSSCEAQEAICRDFATARDWQIAQIFVDEGQSSETRNRPALKELIKAIEDQKVSHVIVYAIDRLTRRLSDLHWLLQLFDLHSVELLVVTDPHFGKSAANRLTTNIIAAACQFQQELTRERMADARAALKQRGRRVAGPPPFGYGITPGSKQLTPHPIESQRVVQFFRSAASGKTPREIAERANREGWHDRRGTSAHWTSRRILALLRNPTYVGRIRNGIDTLPGVHEPIVTPMEFDTVQQQLTLRRSSDAAPRTNRRELQHPLPLLGLVYCGSCQRAMSTSVSHRGNRRYVYYRCRSNAGGRRPCRGVNVFAADLEQCLIDLMTGDSENASPLTGLVREAWASLPVSRRLAELPRFVKRIDFYASEERLKVALWEDSDSSEPTQQ